MVIPQPHSKFRKTSSVNGLNSRFKRYLNDDNYIILYFNHDCTYSSGFGNSRRNDIDFIIEENKKYKKSESFEVIKGYGIEIHFNERIRSLQNFFDAREDKNMQYLAFVDFTNFNSTSISNMEYMFYHSSSLKSIDFSNFDTSHVTNMRHIFEGCSSLESIDISKFDTSKVTSMRSMFDNCYSIKSIDLSNFITSLVNDMWSMFYNCTSLEYIDLSKFDTSHVTDMGFMFYNCTSLESINLLKFDTSLVTNMGYMFCRCASLKSIDLSSFNTFKVINMNSTFERCSSLISIDLSNFDMFNCYSYHNLFSDISNIRYINLYNLKNDKIISKTFNHVSNPIYICQKDIIIDSIKAYNCCDSSFKIYECIFSYNINNDSILIPSDIDKIDTSNTKSSSSMPTWLIIFISVAAVVAVVVIVIFCCICDCPLKRWASKWRRKQHSQPPSPSQLNQIHNFTISNMEMNNENEQRIFEHKPEMEKDNPFKVIFQNPGFGESNIYIDSSESIDELIRFYFEINKRLDLYGDKSIIFLRDAGCIVPPYPKDPIGTLINKQVNSRTIKIIVNDGDDKMKKINI